MLITIAGLPAHPLLVHAAVVLIPLAALGALAIAIKASWRRPYGILVAVFAVLAGLFATAAKFAGDQLEATLAAQGAVGPGIEQHGMFGLYTMYASWPFAVLAVVGVLLARQGGRPAAHAVRGQTATAQTSTAAVVVLWLAALAGLVTLGLVVLTGDSGARAVWGFVTQS